MVICMYAPIVFDRPCGNRNLLIVHEADALQGIRYILRQIYGIDFLIHRDDLKTSSLPQRVPEHRALPAGGLPCPQGVVANADELDIRD